MKRGYPIGAVLAPLILGTLLAFSNWRLIRENRELSATAHYYASLRHTLAGVQVPAIHGKDLAGHDIDIAYRNGNRQTLLFVFSPTCPHCKRNWPAWLDLVKASPDKRIVFANVWRGPCLPIFPKYIALTRRPFSHRPARRPFSPTRCSNSHLPF